MISGLKPYPERKDSGLDWLGEVPAHWEVRRNGRLFAQRNETGYPDLPILEVSLRTGVRVRDFANSTRKQVMSEREKYKRAIKGDVAYNMMRMWQGAVGVVPEHGLISPAYVVARPLPGSNPNYFERLFRTPAYMQEVDNYSRGIVKDRNRLYWEDFKRISTCYPPPDEQTAIVRYLDHLDRRVRRLVRAKRKLIALLTEQKQAIIHRAVTRGLDPDVPLKNSGVEWLGEVPAHWEVRRLKQAITPIEQGWSPQCDAQEARDEDWGVLKVGCVNQDDFDVRQNKRLPGTLEPREELQIQDGDILVSRANTRELLGLAALVVTPRRRILVCDKLFRFRARTGVADSEFLVKAMRDRPSRDQIETQTNGASDSMQNIGQGVIRNLFVALPPIWEQRKIVTRIVAATSAITDSITTAIREIDLLTEYRTRLIADVVTGKLDVREAAAMLPEIYPLAADDESDTLDTESETDLSDLNGVPEEAES